MALEGLKNMPVLTSPNPPTLGAEVRYVPTWHGAPAYNLAAISYVEGTPLGHVQLMIFAHRSDESPVGRVVNVPYDAGKSPGSWHWPND